MLTFVIIAAVGGAAALVLHGFYNKNTRTMRALRTAPAVPLAEIAEGAPGRFSGIVEAFEGQTTKAPISGKPCVYWTVMVYQSSRDAKGNRVLDPVIKDAGGTSFVVRDASGTAVVDPKDAAVAVEPTQTSELLDADGLEAYMTKWGFSTSWLLGPGVEYNERLIEVGETVEVFGAGTREPDPTASPDGYRGQMPTRLRIAHSAQHPLAISDDPRARNKVPE